MYYFAHDWTRPQRICYSHWANGAQHEVIDNNENEEVAQNIKIENDFDNKLAQKLPKSVSILRTQAAPTKIEIQHEPAKENNDKNFDSSNEDFEDFEDFDNDEDYDPDQGSLLKGIDNKTVRT